MFENGMSPADINAVMGNNGMGNGSWSWLIIILFIFLFGTNGFGGFNGNNMAATNADLQRGFDTQSIITKLNGLENGLCSLGYEQQAQINSVNQNVSAQGYNVTGAITTLGSNIAQNFCGVNRNIDALRYDAALNTQKIIDNDVNNTQKILDAITQNQMQAMQSEINRLQLESYLCGVVRYPNATTYTAGGNPFFGGGCGCGYNGAI